MVIKEDQERVLKILKETIALLCKNGLNYRSDLKIEGLIGVTIDKTEIFLINLNESITYDNKSRLTEDNHSINIIAPMPNQNDDCLRSLELECNKSHTNNSEPADEIIKNVKVEISCDSDDLQFDDPDPDQPDRNAMETNNNRNLSQFGSDVNLSDLSSSAHLNENDWANVQTKNQILTNATQAYRHRISNIDEKSNKMSDQFSIVAKRNITKSNTIIHHQQQQRQRYNKYASPSSSSLDEDKLRSHPVVCNMCGKRFPRKLFLQAHLSTQHGLPKPFECVNCGKGYAYKQQLNKHLTQCSFDFQMQYGTERT